MSLTGEKRNRLYSLLGFEVTPTREEGFDLGNAFCTSEISQQPHDGIGVAG